MAIRRHDRVKIFSHQIYGTCCQIKERKSDMFSQVYLKPLADFTVVSS